MPKETNRSLLLAAKKVASIATMASMLSSMLNLGLILPVKAQQYTEAAAWIGGNNYFRLYEIIPGNNFNDLGVSGSATTGTLAALSSFINNPIPGSGNGNENTNISYTFDVADNIEIGEDGGFIKIATNNSNNTINDGQRENWNSSWVSANDPFFNQGNPPPDITFNLPANVSISMVKIIDGNNDGAENTLYIGLECNVIANNNAPCLLEPAPATAYSIDLKNNPLRNPEQAGPHRQNFILGTNAVDQNNGITESGVGKMTINSYYSGLTVSASVDARLTFLVSGTSLGEELNDLTSTDESSPSGCDFGTLVPNTPEVCIWTLNGSTNAANGMQVYVVQDQNMTYPGSGQSIAQFFDGTQTLSATPVAWNSPSTADAHLGYTSDDDDVFPLGLNNEQLFAGITTMSGAGVGAATANTAKVADTNTAGELTAKYANKIETTTRLEQAPASLGQSYGHTQYFVVVGNF